MGHRVLFGCLLFASHILYSDLYRSASSSSPRRSRLHFGHCAKWRRSPERIAEVQRATKPSEWEETERPNAHKQCAANGQWPDSGGERENAAVRVPQPGRSATKRCHERASNKCIHWPEAEKRQLLQLVEEEKKEQRNAKLGMMHSLMITT